MVGAFLSQKREVARWRRQTCTDIFAGLIDELEKATAKVLFNAKSEKLSRTHEALHVARAFLPVEGFVRKARLYLAPDERDNFSELVQEIITLKISLGADSSLRDKINVKESDLQRLIENSVDNLSK